MELKDNVIKGLHCIIVMGIIPTLPVLGNKFFMDTKEPFFT